LLHGDLRQTVERALQHCRRELAESKLMEHPTNAGTKRHYEEIVQFATEFLRGGIYEVSINAYSKSDPVRLRMTPILSAPPAVAR